MTYREWATPLTIGSFLVIAVTGVLMFFHLDTGLNKLAHEWLAWAMIAAVGLHAAAHFRSFSRYFTRPRALAVIGVSLVILAASFLTPPGKSAKPPHVLAVNALLDAPIERVAGIAGRELQTVLTDLRAADFSASADSNLRAVAGPQRERQMQALGIALAKR